MQQKGGDKKRLEIFDESKKVTAHSGDGSRKEQTKARTPMTPMKRKIAQRVLKKMPTAIVAIPVNARKQKRREMRQMGARKRRKT